MNSDDAAMTAHAVKYDVLQGVLDAEAPSLAEKQRLILNELPYTWEGHYLKMVTRRTWLASIEYNGFSYHYDNYTHYEIHGLEPYSDVIEDRVIGVIGRSVPTPRSKKTATWLKGLVGPTEMRWGPQFDKGHFVAQTLGGGEQLNIFSQRRDLNRGRSEAGKIFRRMEKYCFTHPGTLLFHRPIYLEEGARPAALDFGLLMEDGKLWVERFNNRESPEGGEFFKNRIPRTKS